MTKTQYIARFIRDGIMSGRWSPGDRLPGEVDLQAQFGVSRTTIRDALNTLTGEGLVVRKNGNGTFVADTIGLACVVIAADAGRLASPLGYWYRLLVENAQKVITGAGFRPIIAVGNGLSAKDFVSSTNILNSLKSTNIVGVIDTTSVPLFSQTLSSEGVNTVVIECAIPMGDYCVVLDYGSYTRLSVELMQRSGYHDFAVMHYDYDVKQLQEIDNPVWREMARLSQLAISNNADRLVTVPGTSDVLGQSYDAFIKWWKSSRRKNSIFFFDDTLFDVASKAIVELGIEVPEDLAILTHANVGRLFHFPVELTRIGFDAEEVISNAWTLLSKLINGEPVYDCHVKVQPVLRMGDSLGDVALPNRSNKA